MQTNLFRQLIIAATFIGTAAYAQTTTSAHVPDIEIKNAWVRVAVPGQSATGAFMQITAKEENQLIQASSPVAAITEVHEMAIENDIMKMRAIPALTLPAGRTVELKPGSYHIMLLDLKQPLAKDQQVPLTLTFKNASGVESKMDLMLPVTVPPMATKAGAHMGTHTPPPTNHSSH